MIFYKVIKLTNGENILATTDDDCNDIFERITLDIVDPIQIISVRMPKGNTVTEVVVMEPWLKPARKGIINLPVNNIIVIADMEESVLNQYLEFVDHLRSRNKMKQSDYLSDSYLSDNDHSDPLADEIENEYNRTVH